MGQARYPKATRLLVNADGGGSNGSRVRLWKRELQRFADETGLTITCASWTLIPYQRRGQPVMRSTRNTKGLRVECHLDTNPAGMRTGGPAFPPPYAQQPLKLRWLSRTLPEPAGVYPHTHPVYQLGAEVIAQYEQRQPDQRERQNIERREASKEENLRTKLKASITMTGRLASICQVVTLCFLDPDTIPK